jgi:hypothetical protein
MRPWRVAVAFAASLLVAGPVAAAPCAGFTDVDSASGFCPNVEWLKNRSITLGCTSATLFCPDAAVTRLAMAAFLNRLGNALQPEFRQAVQSNVEAVVNAPGVVCETSAGAVANHTRIASATAMLYHQATTAQTVTAGLAYSLNGGISWQPFGGSISRATNPANGFASQSPVAGALLLQPGQSVVFGIGVSGGSISDAGCELTVRLDSHSGAF